MELKDKFIYLFIVLQRKTGVTFHNKHFLRAPMHGLQVFTP